ncbi:hypothetical protein [Paludisphaera sp.]|uniref:hypothetical protein n=1 Tax=Paludisphaera sp. TaxID=2017432 RepID=UPI00301C0228
MMTTFDPDLDTTRHSIIIDHAALVEQQRLVANPLLAAVALLGVWALFRYSLEVRNLYLFLSTLFAACVASSLVQYHCLDCGGTDLALRARHHACSGVVGRVRARAHPPLWPPALRAQVKSWLLVAAFGLVLFAIFHHVG